MQKLLSLILIIILIPIIIEDFRSRKISLIWLFGILINSIILQMFTKVSFSDLIFHTSINLCIVAVNYGILTVYFSIKNKKLINLSNYYLGLGDVIFLISVSFLFSPLNFVCFIIFSLFFTLLYTLFARLVSLNKFKTVPLAGLQSLFLILVLTMLLSLNKITEINNDQFTSSMILTHVGNF